jgi:hypothetical protein
MKTSGWVLFASIMLMIAGMFGIIDGLVALIHDEVYLAGEEAVVALDFTQWGWVHLIAGIIVLAAGLAVLSGQMWARLVGVFVATLHAVSQIAFITVFPLWTITIIALDVIVIFALAVHGEEVERQ